VPVEDVTAVGSVPFSPWLLNFRRADARPLLVSQMHNLLVLIEQVQQANPADPRSPCGRTPSGSLPTGR
jgi:hypothetical protein